MAELDVLTRKYWLPRKWLHRYWWPLWVPLSPGDCSYATQAQEQESALQVDHLV